jgi:predicted nucleic acid-binding protein
VVDASVVLRRLLDGSAEADAVLRRESLNAPGVIVPEVLNGLAGAVRFAGLSEGRALGLVGEALELPIEIIPDRALAGSMLMVAATRQLTAYDASYVALAERLQVPLVTADRRLAARFERSELIP